jgi:hypothetical protein
MATIALQDSAQAGTSLTFSNAAAGGDVASNADGSTLLIVKNASASPMTVTVAATDTTSRDSNVGFVAQASVAKAIAAGATAILGPFSPAGFNNSSGQLAITYSLETSVTLAAVRIHKLYR